VYSDYQIKPEFLRRCAPAFADPWIGFVQAPQDYRGWQGAAYYRRLYYSYKYFFAISQPSRNERDGAIFAGTMGLIRRVVHHRGRRAVAAAAASRLVRPAPGSVLGSRHHAADLRGAEGPAVPVVLRRHPD